MTTALIGKHEQVGLRARVALVSRGNAKNVANLLIRSGHEILEFDGWSSFAAAAAEASMDLVLFDPEFAEGLPRGLSVPAVQVGDTTMTTTASVVGGIATTVIEAALQPLLSMALELRQSVSRCRDLEALVDGVRSGSALVGKSPVMRRLQGALSRAADSDATVLIEGPRGAGKSLAARVIHCKSRRSDHRLEVRGCDEQDPDSLTKALAMSQSTSLLLEGIERLPAASQSVLVRHLKERNASQAAGTPRLMVTTSAHLPELVAKGVFREDLYYRLHAFPIVVPSLRERTDDIQPIALSILDASIVESGKPHQGFTPSALTLLESMPWPGNVAQLEATVRRAQVLAAGGPIDREHLLVPAHSQATTGGAMATPSVEQTEAELDEDAVRPFEEEEQMLLSRALRATKGNVRRAAQLLGIGRATLYRKIQQYKLRLQ